MRVIRVRVRVRIRARVRARPRVRVRVRFRVKWKSCVRVVVWRSDTIPAPSLYPF